MEEELHKINPGIFHAYDIRGIYPSEIDPVNAHRAAWAFVKYLKTDLGKQLPFSLVVGLDMRVSSPFLANEVIKALNDQGVDVIEIGKVSTPAFYSAVSFHECAGGMMITASHMPKEYNGLKICLEKALPVGRDTGLLKIKAYAVSEELEKNAGRGSLTSLDGVTREYVARDLSYVDLGEIKKFKIAADPANCMGATYLEEFFKLISCDPIKVNWELNGNMPIHEANPLKLETLQQLQEIIKNEKADIGIAPDGDGDRISILDERGDPISMDIIAGIVALELLKEHPGAKFVFDQRFSRSVGEEVSAAGGEVIPCRVGYAFIKAKMNEHDALFGGELSGHFFYRENFNFESPIFVIAQILRLMNETGKPLSEIWRAHKKYSHSGEINFAIADKEKAMETLEKKYAEAGGKVSKLDGLKVDYPDWWFNVRPSANDPVMRLVLEARDEAMMKQKVEEISALIKSN